MSIIFKFKGEITGNVTLSNEYLSLWCKYSELIKFLTEINDQDGCEIDIYEYKIFNDLNNFMKTGIYYISDDTEYNKKMYKISNYLLLPKNLSEYLYLGCSEYILKYEDKINVLDDYRLIEYREYDFGDKLCIKNIPYNKKTDIFTTYKRYIDYNKMDDEIFNLLSKYNIFITGNVVVDVFKNKLIKKGSYSYPINIDPYVKTEYICYFINCEPQYVFENIINAINYDYEIYESEKSYNVIMNNVIIKFVKGLVKDINYIIKNIDMDSQTAGFYLKKFYYSDRFVRSVNTTSNLYDPKKYSENYINHLLYNLKYNGFKVIFPSIYENKYVNYDSQLLSHFRKFNHLKYKDEYVVSQMVIKKSDVKFQKKLFQYNYDEKTGKNLLCNNYKIFSVTNSD